MRQDQTAAAEDGPVPGPDVPGQIDVNPASLVERIDSWVDGGVKLIPNFAAALVVLLLAFVLSRVVSRYVERRAQSAERENLGQVLGGFIRAGTLLLGVMLAVTIVFPSITPARVMGSLGIGSVAIGFAFKDILQNWLAGMLILVRRPFDIGDQIKIKEYEGTVKRIETRATQILTYDGQEVLIPNSELYTNSVTVRTAYELRRTEYDVAIASTETIGEVIDTFKRILSTVDTIEAEPAPDAFVWELSAKSFTIRARWWTDSRRSDVVANQARFLRALKEGLDEAGIQMTFDSEVRLVQDDGEDDQPKGRSQSKSKSKAKGKGKTQAGGGAPGGDAITPSADIVDGGGAPNAPAAADARDAAETTRVSAPPEATPVPKG